MKFATLTVSRDGAVLCVGIAAPPMNRLEPELVHDLVTLIGQAEDDDSIKVVVFKSGDPDYFMSHSYRKDSERVPGDASIGWLLRRIRNSRLVTVAQVEGRARGAGSEFVLACDMRFAAKETALFSQMEAALEKRPDASGVQRPGQLSGHALKVMLGACNYSADLAERHGWINRALPAGEIDGFVTDLARRIGSILTTGHAHDDQQWSLPLPSDRSPHRLVSLQ